MASLLVLATRRVSRVAALLGVVGSLCAVPAMAQTTIDFEGLQDQTAIKPGYAGFVWFDFYSLKGSTYVNPGSGFPVLTAATVSQFVAYNPVGQSASFSSLTSFNFLSAQVVSTWRSSMLLTILGFDDKDAQVGVFTAMISKDASRLITPNFKGVNRVVFSTSGGAADPTNLQKGLDGTQFGIDDIKISSTTTVPEPATLGLLAVGLLGVGLTARRRRRA